MRSEYKRIFNEEYQEYLALKAQVEIINKEVTALSNQMAAVKKGTEEAKVRNYNAVDLKLNAERLPLISEVK